MWLFSYYLIQAQVIDYEKVATLWGPLGVICVAFLTLVALALRWGKDFISKTIEDARKDRDYSRSILEQQGKDFLAALKQEQEINRQGYADIMRELNSRRRQ